MRWPSYPYVSGSRCAREENRHTKLVGKVSRDGAPLLFLGYTRAGPWSLSFFAFVSSRGEMEEEASVKFPQPKKIIIKGKKKQYQKD